MIKMPAYFKHKASLIGVLIVYIFVAFSPLAIAETSTTTELIRKGIYWYSPDAQGIEGCYNAASDLPGSDNAEKIWAFFSDPAKDLKDFQIAGIMGNMQHESGLNPNKTQPSQEMTAEEYVAKGWDNADGHAYGIVQWDPGSKLTDNASPLGEANELEFQLNFLWSQLLGEGPVPESKVILKQIRETTTIENAVLAFQGNKKTGGDYYGFERPNDQSGSVADRVAAANIFLEQFQGTVTSINPAGQNCTSSFAGGDFSATVLAYAWPEYHSAPYTKMQPAYKEAVTAAIADGRYVGGNALKGVDCGGFVTLLLTNSGFEPNYNYSGKGGNGDYQEKWLIENSATWERIYPKSSADHMPGDVAHSDSHTYIYVGKIDGFESETASASLDERAPMAASETPADSAYRWYRKKL